MRKIFLLSFDDGVIWDQWFIEMLNHYGVPCTFNLNSGLEDFVWHYGSHPIRRLRLAESKHIYDGHEIASHTLHHNWLDAQTDEQLNWEVGEDVRRLKLNRPIVSHWRRRCSNSGRVVIPPPSSETLPEAIRRSPS